MSELISKILIEIVLPSAGTVVAALAVWAAKKLIEFLDAKTKFMDSEKDIMRKENAKKLLLDAVETSVLETFQTFVGSLKEKNQDGKLTSEEAKEALEMALGKAYDMLSTETVALIQGLFEKDVKEIIRSKIESLLGSLKLEELLKNAG